MKNNINFDKTQYIKLLKNERRSLFNEKRQEDFELLSYGVILENQSGQLNIFERYLSENGGEDEAHLFLWEFFKIFKKNNKALKILEKEILYHLEVAH